MYVLKHNHNKDYLQCVNDCIPYWNSLDDAKLFHSPEDVINHLIVSCVPRNSTDELKEWLDLTTTIERISQNMYIVQWRDGTYLTGIDSRVSEAYWSNERSDGLLFESEDKFKEYAFFNFNSTIPSDRQNTKGWMDSCTLIKIKDTTIVTTDCYVIEAKFDPALFIGKVNAGLIDWESIKLAKTFKSEEDAKNYIVDNSTASSKHVLPWIQKYCVIKFMHPLNLKYAKEK